jgi:hypothetical protein
MSTNAFLHRLGEAPGDFGICGAFLTDARENYSSKSGDWVWPAMASLGLTVDEEMTYEGCSSCNVHPYVLAWYMEGIQRILKPKTIVYNPTPIVIVIVLGDGKLLDVAVSDGEEMRTNLSGIAELFGKNKELKYVTAVGSMQYLDVGIGQVVMGHATSIIFKRNKDNVIEVLHYDSSATDGLTHGVAQVIAETMPGSWNNYTAPALRQHVTRGPQEVAGRPEGNGPVGLCETWSAIVLLVTMLLDGKPTPEEIIADIPEDSLLYYAQTFSLNLTRVAKRWGIVKAEFANVLSCCKKH